MPILEDVKSLKRRVTDLYKRIRKLEQNSTGGGVTPEEVTAIVVQEQDNQPVWNILSLDDIGAADFQDDIQLRLENYIAGQGGTINEKQYPYWKVQEYIPVNFKEFYVSNNSETDSCGANNNCDELLLHTGANPLPEIGDDIFLPDGSSPVPFNYLSKMAVNQGPYEELITIQFESDDNRSFMVETFCL